MQQALKSNLHTHTTFCDGRHTMEENVQEAIKKNFTDLGFSSHALTDFDVAFALRPENIPDYLGEVNRLKALYEGRMNLYAGIEQDLFANPIPLREQLDYVIGSIHFVRINGEIFCIDHTQQEMRDAIAFAKGGAREVVERYYQNLIEAAAELKPDILGHFDIIKLHNTDSRFFDEAGGWYRDIAYHAVDEIGRLGAVAEINTGGMSRGYIDEPYPSDLILSRMAEKGVPVTLSSDAHCKEHLDFAFDEMRSRLARLGFDRVMEYHNGRFVEVPLG